MKNLKNKLSLSIGLMVLMLAMLTGISTAAIAQGPGNGGSRGGATPEERAKRQTEMMKDNLSLTAVQEPKVSAINLK
jgi:hypothetical protein